jgi:uncharacterized membrane protein YhaH (DUF805 family)
MFSIWKDVVFKNYANFKGRDSRGDYWMFFVANIVASIIIGFGIGLVVGLASLVIYIDDEELLTIVGIGLLGLGLTVPLIAATTRRLHDANFSGWFQLLCLIPYLGGVVVLILCLLPGTKGDNKFGPLEE